MADFTTNTNDAWISDIKNDILEQLIWKHKWRGDVSTLNERIKKRLQEGNFTAREQRKLKKLLKSNEKGQITIKEIATHFPGKTEEHVAEFKKNYGRKKRNLESIC